MALVLGVDSSTQATKLELRDATTGRLEASARAPHPPVHPPRSEQEPEAWWSALGRAGGELGRPRIAALAVGGQQHGMVVLDADGSVVRPAKLWNDTESAPDADALVERLGAEAWSRAVGLVPLAAYTITKLAWLRRCEPAAWSRLARVVLPHDWLNLRCTGSAATDRGDASGTGYWSPATGEWRTDLLALVDDGRDWGPCLPTVMAPTEPVGPLVGEARDLFGPALVGPGTGDNMAAALGLGLAPGDVAVSVGTSGTVYAVSDTPVADPTGAVAGFADATGRFLPLLCTLNAAKVLDTVATLLGVDHHGLDELALRAPAGAHGLTLLPYLDGERTPNRPDATGTLAGLRTSHERADLARAAVEGVVHGLLDGLDALAAQGIALDRRLVLTGGGARSRAVRRVVADLSGRAVEVHAGGETVALGAAVQAAAILAGGHPSEVARAWRPEPDAVDEPRTDIDRGALRGAYHELRDQAPGSVAGSG
ncbi:MAG: xylulokinase [Acidimicrobiales bacterium]